MRYWRSCCSIQPRRMKLAIALLTRSRDAPTMPASSSWVTGSDELVGAVGQLEQALGRAAGDVEEHRVGQRLVGRPQPLGQQPGDAPQQRAAAASNSSSTGSYGTASTRGRLERPGLAERGRPSSMPISPNRSPGSISATTLSRRSIGLAMAMAMRPRSDDVQRVGVSPSWNSTSPRMSCCSGPAAADRCQHVARSASAKNSVPARRSSS